MRHFLFIVFFMSCSVFAQELRSYDFSNLWQLDPSFTNDEKVIFEDPKMDIVFFESIWSFSIRKETDSGAIVLDAFKLADFLAWPQMKITTIEDSSEVCSNSGQLLLRTEANLGGSMGPWYQIHTTCWDFNSNRILFEIREQEWYRFHSAIDEGEVVEFVDSLGNKTECSTFYLDESTQYQKVVLDGDKIQLGPYTYYGSSSTLNETTHCELVQTAESHNPIGDDTVEHVWMKEGIYLLKNGKYILQK